MRDNIAKEILSNALDIEIDEINDDASMSNINNWDSLGHIKIILEIENKLNRTLETEEVITVYNLDSINELLKI